MPGQKPSEAQESSPAVVACHQGNAAALKDWLDRSPQSLGDVDEDGDDLLDIVVSRSHIDCLGVLVNAGADPTAWEDGASASLLHLASEMSSPEMVLYLVQRCGLPVDGLNGNEQTPLENVIESTIVVDEDKAPRVQALLDAGARCTFPLSKDLKRSLRKHPVTQAVFDKLLAQRQAEHLDSTLPDPTQPLSRPRF